MESNRYYDPIKTDENIQKTQKKKKKLQEIPNIPKEIQYPTRHFLQLLLPFVNEICNVLNASGITPYWLYNTDSNQFWIKSIVYIVNCISGIGIVWNSSYMAGKHQSELSGLLVGTSLLILAYVIPNLFLRKLLRRLSHRSTKLLTGFFIITMLFTFESLWATYVEKTTPDYQDMGVRRKHAILFTLILILILLTILLAVASYVVLNLVPT